MKLDFETLFELMQIQVQCSKNYLKICLPKEAGAFRNNIEKKPQKPSPKLKKYVCYIFTDTICSAQSRPQRIFSLQEESEKEVLEHFKHVSKFAQIEGIFFRIN